MRPTVEEQLDGVRRLLEGVQRDQGLSPASRELLVNAARLVKHVRGAWASTLPFLVEDNRRLTRLLTGLSDVAPGISPAIAEEDAGERAALDVDVIAASARNAELRSVLARAIRELPRTGSGDSARAEVGSYLRWRVQADPV